VFAHPDDDTYGVAGSLALHAGPGLEVTVIMTTSGEAGLIADATLATRETLGAAREAEDRLAWRALGIEPTLHFLRHPDGGVAAVPQADLVAEYLSILEGARPDVVITFGPDGVTAHADHVAVGAAATAAFHAARAAGADGLHRLLHVAIPASSIERLNELLRQRGLTPIDPTQDFQPRGVPDGTIGMAVDCAEVYERKLQALRCHRTQAELEDVPFELWPEMLAVEAFVLGYPERAAGGAVLRDLFEGLPDP
jgi:N-acetyl-1-D-myo-inositol-2-amino-2-deoxy-alpha-D-glucopyranoside deacetylase